MKTTAIVKNLLTGDQLEVEARTDHPDSSYGLPVWVTADGESIGQVGMPLLGFEVIEETID